MAGVRSGGEATAIAIYAGVRAVTPPEMGVRTEVLDAPLDRDTVRVRATYTHEIEIPMVLLVQLLADGRRP